MSSSDAAAIARKYYRSIDGDEYDELASLLADGFVHDRPDRTIEGREQFVAFMREGRPETDTEHVLEDVYVSEEGAAAEGRLLRNDGSVWFRYVDTFDIESGAIAGIRTYTDSH